MVESPVRKARRLVVKVGTYTLSDPAGRLDRKHMEELVRQIAVLRASGKEIILVSSGAIAAGVELLGLGERPRDIPSLQAASSVGQGLLLHLYSTFFSRHGVLVGQVLLTQYDFAHRQQYLNAGNTFQRLLSMGVIPLVNENDTVAVDEIKFGDNDRLAAMVAVLTGSDLLVMLSDIEGLYTADPRKDPGARLLHEVEAITPEINRMAGKASREHSSGGMAAKLEAARIASGSGIGVIVAPGRRPGVLEALEKGERVGTYFHPGKKKMRGHKHWIAYGARPRGRVVVDEGAKKALVYGGKSLLPAGVTGCSGDFDAGDAVEVVDEEGRVLARGICSYSSRELERIKGMRSGEVAEVLGEGACEEVVHRDYLALLEEGGSGE